MQDRQVKTNLESNSRDVSTSGLALKRDLAAMDEKARLAGTRSGMQDIDKPQNSCLYSETELKSIKHSKASIQGFAKHALLEPFSAIEAANVECQAAVNLFDSARETNASQLKT